MSNSVHAVPDPSEELARKSNATLVMILEKIESTEWSYQRGVDALDVLWGVCSGLVDRDLMDTITATHTHCTAEIKAGREFHGERASTPHDQDEMGTW